MLARRLEQSRNKEQRLGTRLDHMDALQNELEERVAQLIEWTRAQLSEGLSERIWKAEWIPSGLRGSLIDLVLALASLSRAVRQPIQEMLLEARLNRVKMRRTALERDLAQTRAQQVALEVRLEQMRASAAAGASPLAQPLDGSPRL